MDKPIHFEYQDFPGIRVVALDSKLSDYGFQLSVDKGQMVMKKPEVTVKDCRNIDGCVYFHLGHVPDGVMCDLIEKFQKLLQDPGWQQNVGLIVPDHKFKI